MPQTRMIENEKDRQSFGITMSEYETVLELADNIKERGKANHSNLLESIGEILFSGIVLMENMPDFIKRYNEYRDE